MADDPEVDWDGLIIALIIIWGCALAFYLAGAFG